MTEEILKEIVDTKQFDDRDVDKDEAKTEPNSWVDEETAEKDGEQFPKE